MGKASGGTCILKALPVYKSVYALRGVCMWLGFRGMWLGLEGMWEGSGMGSPSDLVNAACRHLWARL